MKRLNEINDWREMIGTVMCADALELMKRLPDKSIDLVLTDPPYGIGYSNKKLNRPSGMDFDEIENDLGEIDYLGLVNECIRVSRRSVIFGAINFFKALPYKGIWVCWDKRVKQEADGVLGSPFELAWCDKQTGYHKIYRVMHGGIVNADGGKRFHPTQKPVKLFRPLINDFMKDTDGLILDPFMGSFTTAIAAEDLGRQWIGCDLSEKYCKIGEQRINDFRAQPKLL